MRRIYTKDQDLIRLQDAVAQSVEPIENISLVKGQLLTGIVITSGTIKDVEHKLARTYQGWFVVRRNANANVWESTSTFPDKLIKLNSSANVTVDLWVF